MLDYEWGNPSSIMLTGDVEPTTQDSDSNRPFFDHYSHTTFNDSLLHTTPNHFTPHQHHHFDTQNPTHFSNSLYDPRAYTGACASYPTNPSSSMLSLEPLGVSNPAPNGYMVVPKTEPAAGGVDFMSRIGLKLGGRTYFSSSDDDFLCRLYRRPRPLEAGLINAPRCQAEGCNADLTHAKHYHRRHKVCEYHSKASTVIAAGLTQRFCQQCSRFHLLTEFDNGKRSCRRRLADHNRRRRKSNQNQNQDQNMSHLSTTQNSSSENFPIRSPPDSGAQSSSSVTVAISPPRISLDCFRSYHATATSTTTTTSTSSASTSSLFHSNG